MTRTRPPQEALIAGSRAPSASYKIPSQPDPLLLHQCYSVDILEEPVPLHQKVKQPTQQVGLLRSILLGPRQFLKVHPPLGVVSTSWCLDFMSRSSLATTLKLHAGLIAAIFDQFARFKCYQRVAKLVLMPEALQL